MFSNNDKTKRFTMMLVDCIDDDEHKIYKGYGHILAIGRDNPSQFFQSTRTYIVSFPLFILLFSSTGISFKIDYFTFDTLQVQV